MLRCALLWDSQAELKHRAEAQEALGAAKLKDSLLKAESHTTIDSR